MRYAWGEYAIDRAASLMTRYGHPVEMSRRTLECIAYLVEHRDRVVSHDELIRRLWGHDDVTNHQLAQIVLSARKAVGDDGHSQRLIRTVPGVGYHWVGVVKQAPDHPPAPDRFLTTPEVAAGVDGRQVVPNAQVLPGESSPARPGPPTMTADTPSPGDRAGMTVMAEDPAAASVPTVAIVQAMAEPVDTDSGIPASSPPVSTAPLSTEPVSTASVPTAPASGRWPDTPRRVVAMVVLCLAAVLTVAWGPGSDPPAPAMAQGDPIAELKEALELGRFEDVREGLAKLPRAVAESPEAGVLEIQLDVDRGRLDNALEKVARQEARALAAGNTLWRAQLLVERGAIHNRMETKTREEVLRPIQAALDLLEDMGDAAPKPVLARALSARSLAWIRYDDLARAGRDITRARDLYVESGDARKAALSRASLARVWMRTGRLQDALVELQEAAITMRRLEDRISEVYALNRMTRIQMELLRWQDALASSDQAMSLVRELPDSDRRYRCLGLRAQVLAGMGRLREARALLVEAEALPHPEDDDFTIAQVLIEAHDYRDALAAATRAFHARHSDDNGNILFESKDGALLLWVIAAQGLHDSGEPLSVPDPALRERLAGSGTTLGHVARGRWWWSQGRLVEAETELRRAMTMAQSLHQHHRMRLTGEALVGVLLQRGDVGSALTVIDDLRAFDPDAFDADYRARVLALRVSLALGDQRLATNHRIEATRLAGERMPPGLD